MAAGCCYLLSIITCGAELNVVRTLVCLKRQKAPPATVGYLLETCESLLARLLPEQHTRHMLLLRCHSCCQSDSPAVSPSAAAAADAADNVCENSECAAGLSTV